MANLRTDHAHNTDSAQPSLGSDDAPSRIVAAATFLFRQKGFHTTSIDEIAARAHMSKRTIYEHFTNKHAILEATLIRFTAAAFQKIAAREAQTASASADLLAVISRLQEVAIASESVAMVRLQIAEAQHLPEMSEKLTKRGLQQTIDLLNAPLQRMGVVDIEKGASLAYDLLVLAPLYRRLTGSSHPENDPAKIIELILSVSKS